MPASTFLFRACISSIMNVSAKVRTDEAPGQVVLLNIDRV
jgi:hypothetical protein